MNRSFDVVVVGGGTSGTPACIAAGRLGARTLVIEQLGSLGGTQSNGWVTPMMPNYLGPFHLSRGISLELVERQAALQPPGDVLHGEVWYDPVMLALVMDRVATEAGVTRLYNSAVSDVRVENGRIQAIEVLARGGRFWVEGRCFVDASGDGELSRLAGAQMMGGNDEGVHQPMTLRFFMGGVDIDEMRGHMTEVWWSNTHEHVETGTGDASKHKVFGPMVAQAIADGVLEEDDLGYFQIFTMNGRPGELAFNCPRVSGLDPTDPFELSVAYQVGREKVYRIGQFMKRYWPGCKNAYISGIAPLIGIRESRRVVGEYILTADDHQACRKFPNTIARNNYPVDIHLTVGVDYRKFPPGEYHDIPYGSIVVKGFDNLWVAGRCLSADFVAQSSVRIQPVCRAMGEAAGVAAALCARDDLAAQNLPYSDLAAYLDLSLPEGGSVAPSVK